MSGTARRPWERRKGETARAFEGFQAYRDMGSERGLRKVAEKIGTHQRSVERWSSQHDWVARAEAWDRHLDRKKREKMVEEVEKMAERHAKRAQLNIEAVSQISQAIIKKIRNDPDALEEYSVGTLVDMLGRVGYLFQQFAQVERLARGEATERVETSLEGSVETKHTERRELEVVVRNLLNDPEAADLATALFGRLADVGEADAGGHGEVRDTGALEAG